MKKDINRREFMKVTAQGVAVTGLVGLVPMSGISAITAEPSKKGIGSEWITSLVKDYVTTSPNNSIRNAENEKAWDEPLVGFSSGDDPIYQFFKEDIGPFYWTPLEIFKLIFPESTVKPNELSVISWVLPHTESIKADLRKKKKTPSEKWIRARLYGGEFIDEMSKYVADTLTKSGYPAFAPTLTKIFNPMTVESKRYGLSTSWSERHAAYASGLGTFGLCDGLITSVGKAIRCGSVIARIKVPPTPRPYKDHHAYCLYYAKGTCGMCVKRCPAGAVTKSGHDKYACAKQCMSTCEYATKELGLPPKAYGCGFCQTGVPCESKIPVKI
ncbi:MAG: epoxyqueuosine reductase [Desulfobacteraceae bacterium]|jgi:epoxyqueuosine reductase QueG